MTKPMKHDPRSEAAQRAALKRLAEASVSIQWLAGGEDYEIYAKDGNEIIAIFDLRDCYRKRQPLTGITKKLKAAIRPKRRAGK